MRILQGSVRVRYAFDPKDKIPICLDYSLYEKQGMGIKNYDRVRTANAKSHVYHNDYRKKS